MTFSWSSFYHFSFFLCLLSTRIGFAWFELAHRKSILEVDVVEAVTILVVHTRPSVLEGIVDLATLQTGA